MKATKRLTRLQRPGAALPMVMSTLVLLLTIGTGLLSLGLHSRTFAVRTGDQIQARCAADAGMTKALSEMNEMLKVKPWNDSILPQATDQTLPNCDATLSYTVTGNTVSGYTIECTGSSGRAQRIVRAGLRLQGLFEYAIFTEDQLELQNNTTLDWYNYDAEEEPLKIGTNKSDDDSIKLHNSVIVNGDVLVGVEGDPADVIKLDMGAIIAGETGTLAEEYELLAITVPQWLESLPSGGDIKEPTTITTSGKYTSINLKNSEIVKIDGPVVLYVTGDIGLDTRGELQIVDSNPDASLTLYLEGDFISNHDGLLNNLTKDPTRLKIYALDGCEKIDFKSACDFYGAIYARNAEIQMHNSVNVYGAISAYRYKQDQSTIFMYDASLRDVSINDVGVRFVVERWREE